MSTDYFAHAVYGVELFAEEQEELNTLLGIAVKGDNEDDEDDRDIAEILADQDRDPVELVASDKALLARLRRGYGAPPDTMLFWTGLEDDRPGRCATAPGTWLLGHGMGSLPGASVPADWREKASWHTWVTAG